MNITLIISILFIGIIIFLFYRWNNRPVYWKVEDVERLLQSVIDDNLDYEMWDYYEACEIKNPALEQIRQESFKVYAKNSPYLDMTAKTGEIKLNDKGIEKYQDLIKRCQILRNINES